MRHYLFALLLVLLLSGCFETNFNFETVIRRDGSMDRKVQIEGRSADRFLPPSGPEWTVKTFETKGEQPILEDVQYHIHGKGHFAHADDFTSDFQYDVSRLIANLTPETREELVHDLGLPEPLENEVGAANQVDLVRERSFWRTTYEYRERFQVRRLIPILIHDLKKEIHRKRSESSKLLTHALSGAQAGTPSGTSEPIDLSAAELEELAKRRLVEEILPAFRFHSEVTLPGVIVDTNATRVRRQTAIWDFNGVDFEDDFSVYQLRVTSRSSNIGLIIAVLVIVVSIIGALVLRQRRVLARRGGRRSRNASSGGGVR